MAADKSVFDVKRSGELIRVFIEGDEATFVVAGINSVGIVIEALNRAVSAGATRGTLFTGEVVNDQIAAMHEMRFRTGTTWLGGKVTFLSLRTNGPEFRIDWDQLPTITE